MILSRQSGFAALRPPRQDCAGIALIIVMVSILVLAVLAGGFAYSMKVETKLARNANFETELEWLGRSAVEEARWILAQQLTIPGEPYDSLNQVWAGGPGGVGTSNSPLAGINLNEPVYLGNGSYTRKIVDLERKLNINLADQDVLQRAMILIGVDAAEFPTAVSSILDWIDRDNLTHISGTESDYYQGFKPPYEAKNGPIDDLSELLLVRGVTPEMYWGAACTNFSPAAALHREAGRFGRVTSPVGYAVGLVDLFTPISSGRVNINTAPVATLSLVMPEEIAARVVSLRSGPDGTDGTPDDLPAGGPGGRIEDLLVSAGLGYQAAQQVRRFLDVRSSTFEVQVEAEVSGYKRQFVAVLGRRSPRDVQILSFSWR